MHRSEDVARRSPGRWKWTGAFALVGIVAVASFQAGRWNTAQTSGASIRSEPESPGAGVGVGVGAELGEEGTASGPGTTAARGRAVISLPADSIAEILALPTDFSQTYAAYALAAQSDEDALLGLIDDANQVANDNDRRALVGILISRYGEIDPARALNYIASSNLEAKPGLVYRVVNSWSKVDLDAALEAPGSLDGQNKAAAADGILAAHAGADQAFVADLRERLAAPAAATSLSQPMVLRMAMTDPRAALTEAARLGQDRMIVTFGIGGIWAQTDPEGALAHSRTISDPAVRDALQRGIFVTWTVSDPGTALGFLEPDASDTEQAAILNAGLVRLAQGDPRRAFSEVGAIEDASLRNAALQRVFRAWAQQDPFAASAALVDEVATEDALTLGIVVGREFALRAPAQALDWASGFDDGSGATYRNALTEVAKIDAQVALDSALKMAEAGKRADFFGVILSTVAERDPVAAAGYWQQVPAEARAEATLAVVTRWQAQDAPAAADWLLGLPAGPDRDTGLGRMVAMAQSDDPNVLRLIGAISAADTRDQSALNRIRRLARDGELTRAELELGQLDISNNAYNEAIALIDASR